MKNRLRKLVTNDILWFALTIVLSLALLVTVIALIEANNRGPIREIIYKEQDDSIKELPSLRDIQNRLDSLKANKNGNLPR